MSKMQELEWEDGPLVCLVECSPVPYPENWSERMSVFAVDPITRDVYFCPEFIGAAAYLFAMENDCPMITAFDDWVMMSADWIINKGWQLDDKESVAAIEQMKIKVLSVHDEITANDRPQVLN